MITKTTLHFLKQLKKNNTRDWFHENKSLYDAAKKDVESFLEVLILKLSEFDQTLIGLEPKDCMFRIYRDVRFAKDKSPYKTNFGAVMTNKGRKSMVPGYYFHLSPGESFLGGGVYRPLAPQLQAIREEIDGNAQPLRAIINDKTFKKNFDVIWGDQVKLAPKGYPKDHPEIDLLRYKDFVVKHDISDETVLHPDFISYCINIFKGMQPFNKYMRYAVNAVVS